MPTHKGLEQAMTWLRSKMAEGDTLDAINAEVCYNVICDLKEKRKVIGALYHQTYASKRAAEEKIDQLYCDAIQAMEAYSQKHKTNEQTRMNI